MAKASAPLDRVEILKQAVKAKDFASLLKTLGVNPTDNRKVGAVRRALSMARNKGLALKVLAGEGDRPNKKDEKEEWANLAKTLGVKFDPSKFKARKKPGPRKKTATKTK